MQESQNQSLFSLSIDPVTKTHLIETSKWARFLAIVGFIALGLMLLFGIYMSTVFSSMDRFDNLYGRSSSNVFSMLGAGMAVFYIVVAVIMFFPLLFLLRFANRMRSALAGNDQEVLNGSFQNLKAYFRYLGVITIIGLAFYALTIIIAILGAATS